MYLVVSVKEGVGCVERGRSETVVVEPSRGVVGGVVAVQGGDVEGS